MGNDYVRFCAPIVSHQQLASASMTILIVVLERLELHKLRARLQPQACTNSLIGCSYCHGLDSSKLHSSIAKINRRRL